jgi:hypothetical protein
MESVRSCEGLGEGTRVNQQMRTGMNAVSQIGDRRGTLERCREGKEEAVHYSSGVVRERRRPCTNSTSFHR